MHDALLLTANEIVVFWLLTAFEASFMVLVVADHDFLRCIDRLVAFRAFSRLHWFERHLCLLKEKEEEEEEEEGQEEGRRR